MSGTEHPLFQYEPLPTATSTRLVRLKPGTIDENRHHDFHCSFEVAETRSPPSYIAISYCWGDMGDMVPIPWDDGTFIMATRAVHEFLSQTLSSGTPTTRPIWIDALCINQKDLDERAAQVVLMADIYSKATNVLVWLGPNPRDDAEPLFAAFKALLDEVDGVVKRGHKLKFLDPKTRNLRWDWAGMSFLSPMPSALMRPNDQEKSLLTRFFNLAWFSRTWILQEVGNAAKAWLVWGKKAIGWNIVGVVAMFMIRFAKEVLKELDLVDVMQNVYHIYTLFSPFTPRCTFFHLVCTARRFHASNPSDKLFALLSHPAARFSGPSFGQVGRNASAYSEYINVVLQLLPNVHDEFMVRKRFEEGSEKNPVDADSTSNGDVSLAVTVDYRAPTEDVYRNFTLQHVEKTESLEILTAVQHDPSLPDIPSPSWVPRWDRDDKTTTFGLLTSTHFASANRRAIVQPPSASHPDQLIVRGHIFSRTFFVSDVCSAAGFDIPDDPKSTTNAVMATYAWTGLVDLNAQGHRYPRLPILIVDTPEGRFAKLDNDLTLEDAYLRTWVAGKNLSEVDGFDVERDSGEYCRRVLGLAPPGGLPPEGSLERAWADEEGAVRAERYRSSVAEAATGRRFFLTKKMFMGLGPAAMRKGDWVAVLLGADVPFVLREVDAELRDQSLPLPPDVKFQLVGECYVQGLMTGGAIKGVEVKRDITLV